MLPEASTVAHNFERLYDFIFWVSLISFVGVVLATIYFVVKYHRTRRDPFKTPYITGHSAMEISVSSVLLVIVMLIFYFGWVDYKRIVTFPTDNTMEVHVIARQWMWQFEYPNGRKLTNELVVPKGRDIKLIMSSDDVLHSFYVPNFRLKQDVVPGSYTRLWFNATLTGEHPVFCAEYCGTAHSKMLGKVRVLESAEYDKWAKDWKPGEAGANTNPVDYGKDLFIKKGCLACHTVTGQSLVGPTLLGVFGKEEEMSDGKKVVVDENYFRESLMQPQIKVVKGFPPVMPTFQGTLSEEEINALISYIKSLKK